MSREIDPHAAVDQARVREMFDYADGRLLRRVRTGPRAQVGIEAGTFNQATGYRQIKIEGRIYLTHRLVFLWHHGWLPQEIDHINGNSADNRIENLRAASRSQNNCNASIRADNTSGVKGVYWSKRAGKWHARIWVNRKPRSVGYFDDLHAATFAREQENKLHNGEFARSR